MPAPRAIGCALLALLICLTLTSCAHLPGGPVISDLPAPQTARQGLENRRLAVKSFAMSGEIDLKTPQGELHGDHVIIGQAPDRLRAEVLGPFGQPLLRVVVDGRRLSVLSFRENRAYVGAASRHNLARFLGLSLSPSEVFAVLIGAPPLLAQGSRARVSPVEGGEGVLLRLVEPGRQVSQGIVFDQGDFAVHRAWLEDADGRMNLETSTYRARCSRPWAHAILSSSRPAMAMAALCCLTNDESGAQPKAGPGPVRGEHPARAWRRCPCHDPPGVRRHAGPFGPLAAPAWAIRRSRI